jgi:hypothetical protein
VGSVTANSGQGLRLRRPFSGIFAPGNDNGANSGPSETTKQASEPHP